MPIERANPNLSPLVWWSILAVSVIVLLGGGVLFLLPDVAAIVWPWRLTPFNMRFLGAIYLSQLCVSMVILRHTRWSPARLLLYLGLTFATVVSVASIVHFDRFDPARRATWLWFVLYVGLMPLGYRFLIRYWRLPAVTRHPLAPGLALALLVQAIVYSAYFVALWVVPAQATAFWPWPVDTFHAHVYSGIFLVLGMGAGIIWLNGAHHEILAFAAAQTAFAILVPLGSLLVDLQVKRIVWSAPGTMVWVASFLALGVLGALQIRAAQDEQGMAPGRHVTSP